MRYWILLLFALLSVQLVFPAQSLAESPVAFPCLEAETILGKDFKIPEGFEGHATWIVIGFTKDSQKSTTLCSDKLEQNFKGRGYAAAILQGAPFFIKGIIKSGIRSSVPEIRRERFLVLNEGKDELKKILEFDSKASDDAYIVGLRSRAPGSPLVYDIAFKSHGVCDDAHFAALIKMIGLLSTI